MGAVDIASSVPLQGSYVARRCPVVAQLEYDESLDVEEVPLSEAEQARTSQGRRHGSAIPVLSSATSLWETSARLGGLNSTN